MEIVECQPLPDGRFYLEVQGRRRFSIADSWEQVRGAPWPTVASPPARHALEIPLVPVLWSWTRLLAAHKLCDDRRGPAGTPGRAALQDGYRMARPAFFSDEAPEPDSPEAAALAQAAGEVEALADAFVERLRGLAQVGGTF